MAAPIIFISRNRIVKGKGDAVAEAYASVVGVIASTKPLTALFAAYLDPTGTEVHVVHAFPNGDAMSLHFAGSEERSAGAAEVIVPAGFQVYGQAPPAAMDQLRREAGAAGVRLEVHSEALGGFLRAPQPSAVSPRVDTVAE